MVLKTDRVTAAIEFYSELLPTWWCSGAKKILLRYAIVEVGLGGPSFGISRRTGRHRLLPDPRRADIKCVVVPSGQPLNQVRTIV